MQASRPSWRGAVLLLAATLIGAGCSEEPPRRRALLIGIDGATFALARPMIEAGRLPNLARLESEGASGRLRSAFPLLSPRIWTSIATGREVAQHGIEGWVKLDAAGKPKLYSSRDRRVHALWNILSRYGRRVAVVNWLITQPPEKIEGVMVSDHAAPGMASNQRDLAAYFAKRRFGDIAERTHDEGSDYPVVWPTGWVERVARARGETSPTTHVEDPFAGDAASAGPVIGEMLERTYRNDGFTTRLALEVEAATDPDLMMVYLPGIDRVSHFLWGDLETERLGREGTPGRSVEMATGGAEALRGYYAYTDALIGLLVERYGADDLVMIVSDHGFETLDRDGRRTGGHETEAARDGLLIVRGGDAPAGTRDASMGLLDVAPTILTWLGLPVARDMPGRAADFVPASGLDPVDTHDVGEIERPGRIEEEVEADIIDELRALGYLD